MKNKMLGMSLIAVSIIQTIGNKDMTLDLFLVPMGWILITDKGFK